MQFLAVQNHEETSAFGTGAAPPCPGRKPYGQRVPVEGVNTEDSGGASQEKLAHHLGTCYILVGRLEFSRASLSVTPFLEIWRWYTETVKGSGAVVQLASPTLHLI